MRIMMFLASRGRGGAEKVVCELANLLADRHEVSVLAYEHAQWTDALHSDVRQLSLGNYRSRWSLSQYMRLYRLMDEIKPDIVHAHGAKAARLISTLSRFKSFVWLATKHNARKARVFDGIEHVVAVSGQVAATINKQVEVIYNGIQPAMPVGRLPQSGPFQLLAIGRLEPIKGFSDLLEVVPQLPENIRLQIVGQGRDRQVLEDRAWSLGLAGRVEFLGYCDNVPELMATAHAVVIASHSEGFSLVMVESLFYANLLLTTDVGGASEVLPQSLVYQRQDMLSRLSDVVADYDTWRAVFSACKKEKKMRFHARTMASTYEDYYQRCLNQ